MLLFHPATSRILFFSLVALVTVLSVLPDDLVPGANLLSQVWDKAQHFMAYTVLSATAIAAYPRRPGWPLLGLVALGGLLEVLQFVTGRDASLLDFAANTLGVIIVVATWLLTASLRARVRARVTEFR